MEELTKDAKQAEEKEETKESVEETQEKKQTFIAKEEDEFATLLEESFKKNDKIVEGEVVEGKVLNVSGDFVIVDIGYKSEGQVPKVQFKEDEINPGMKVEVTVK